MEIKIDWAVCKHGHPLRLGRCHECEKEKMEYKSLAFKKANEIPTRIAIKRGCRANGGCFCDGSCQEIVGHRDPLYPGEKQH